MAGGAGSRVRWPADRGGWGLTALAEPLVLHEGDYLTDGQRLVQIRRVLDDAVTVESGPVDAPEIGALPNSELAANWRLIEVPSDASDDTDAWIAKRFALTVPPEERRDPREVCGCSRCRQVLDAERGVESS